MLAVDHWCRRIPMAKSVAAAYRRLVYRGSGDYWESRYRQGGDSGSGSAGGLASFKADVINDLVRRRRYRSVIELGCGDGRQLRLAEYPQYTGLDVSLTAVRHCIAQYADDPAKSFFYYDPTAFQDHAGLFRAELALSLDVVFHLTEDRVFETYLSTLFSCSSRGVLIYSSNLETTGASPHVRHRRFTDWIETRIAGWRLSKHIPNRFPYDAARPEATSLSEFFLFERDAEGVR